MSTALVVHQVIKAPKISLHNFIIAGPFTKTKGQERDFPRVLQMCIPTQPHRAYSTIMKETCQRVSARNPPGHIILKHVTIQVGFMNAKGN